MLRKILDPVDCKIFEKSVRDIVKILNDFEDNFIKEKIKITDDFYFLSDTPFIRLLSIFRGLGIKKNEMSVIFHRIEIEYAETNNSASLLKLLGCFVMNKEDIAKGGKIYYNGVVYEMLFNKDQDGYSTIKSIEFLGGREYAQKEGIRNLYIEEIFKIALKYVN